MSELEQQIQKLWEHRGDLTAVMPESDARDAIHAAINLLDGGEARVAEPAGERVIVHQWLKQAILLLFQISKMETIELGPFEYADKIPLKHNYEEAGVRVVPGGSARWGSYVGRGAILMPSYVNIGAYVGAETMVDTWATVGSCAQIGERVHLSGGVGIGGVLEPAQAAPVVVGDDSLVGSRSMITWRGRKVLRARRGRPSNPGSRSSTPVTETSLAGAWSLTGVSPWSVSTPPRRYPGGEFGLPWFPSSATSARAKRENEGKTYRHPSTTAWPPNGPRGRRVD